jgi:hypothetical protein
VLAVTQDVIAKGIVQPMPEADARKSAVPVERIPGRIVFVAHPMSFWERLLYPLVKKG